MILLYYVVIGWKHIIVFCRNAGPMSLPLWHKVTRDLVLPLAIHFGLSSPMANLMHLPDEIINYILMCENIDIKDILNFGLTCKRLHATIDNEHLWRHKLFQRWPSLKRVSTEQLNDNISMKEAVIEGIKYEKELSYCLPVLACMDTYTKDLCGDDMAEFDVLFFMKESPDSLRYYYFHDKLTRIMKEDPLGKQANLTNIYYARKFMVYMKQSYVKKKWLKFINLLDEQQTLEQVATLVAQWCQPCKHVFLSDIAASLDSIVQQTLKVLNDIHPDHSIFTTSPEQLSLWKNNNISDNHWNKREARQIIDVIGRVIFRELDFHGCDANSEGRYSDPKIFFIDQVLKNKRGSSISLAIIIQSVARRLGIRCDLISFPSHLFLSWRESYKTDCNDQNDWYYIDLFSDGSILSKKDCRRYRWYEMADIYMSNMEYITPAKVVLRLIKNLQYVFSQDTNKHYTLRRSLFELLHMVTSPDLGNWLDASSVSVYTDIDVRDEIIKNIVNIELAYIEHIQNICKRKDMQDAQNIRNMHKRQDIQNMLNLLKIESIYAISYTLPDRPNPHMGEKKNSKVYKQYDERIYGRHIRKHLKYAIGMLVEDESRENAAGVIIGWTTNCSFDCIHYPAWPCVSGKCYRDYTILTCNDTEVIVSQGSLRLLKMQKWIDNSNIGRYFSHFEGTHYVPNKRLQKLFPIDVEILGQKYPKS